MPRDYHHPQRQRLPLAKILFSLGIFMEDVAELLRIGRTTAALDFHRLGGHKAFPKRPNRHTAFATILAFYAELMGSGRKSGATSRKLRKILTHWGGFRELRAFILALTMQEDTLLVPDYGSHAGFFRLLCHVFDCEPPKSDARTRTERLWKKYLEAVRTGQVRVPASRAACEEQLLDFCTRDLRGKIMPVWPEDLNARINRIFLLAKLTRAEQGVMRVYYGLGRKAMTLKQIGRADLGLGKFKSNRRLGTRANAHRIKRNALHKLRLSGSMELLRPFMMPGRLLFATLDRTL